MDDVGASLLPYPYSEICAPLLVEIAVPAVARPRDPIRTEPVAVGRWVGSISDLTFGDRDDATSQRRDRRRVFDVDARELGHRRSFRAIKQSGDRRVGR